MEAFLPEDFLVGMEVGEWIHGVGRSCVGRLGAPAGDFEDAAEADGVEGFGATALTAEAGEFDEHFGGAGGVTIAKFDEIVAPAF